MTLMGLPLDDKRLLRFIAAAANDGWEGTVGQLMEFLEWRDSPLEAMVSLHEICQLCGIVSTPELGTRDQDTVTLFKRGRPRPVTTDTEALIDAGEQQTIEFKSTLCVPTKPLKALKYDADSSDSDKAAAEKAEAEKAMIQKLLRDAAIAAVSFLNSGGGVLLIGVDDDHRVLGIEPDRKHLGVRPGDQDLLTRLFADKVRSQIHSDGESARAYMEFNVVLVDGHEIMRVDVRPRWTVTYIKTKGGSGPELYERVGRASPVVPIDRFQEFLSRTGRAVSELPRVDA